ncbi:MAG: protocatechuate 3,4-dioxygenase subunit alpha [Vicinamibacterales bacterium]
MAVLTPFQTVGPFFDFALTVSGAERLAGDDTAGQRITIEGIVLDGQHQPCGDALIEIWQADGAGHYRHPTDVNRDPSPNAFPGFGRCGTDEAGRFSFSTIMPGPVPGPSGPQAPHVLVGVLARGLLTRLVTRIYFEGSSSNVADPILQRVPTSRQPTLIAKRLAPNRYHFPIVLQGEGETVFFDV